MNLTPHILEWNETEIYVIAKFLQIESGEQEDKRPAVKSLTRFSAFEEEGNDVDAEFA